MVIGVSVITCSLLYSLLLLAIYLKKERIKTVENKIYSILIIINVFGLLLELLCTYFTYNYGSNDTMNILCAFFNKVFIIYLLTWEFVFTLYMFFISFGSNPKYKEKIAKSKQTIITSVVALSFIMICISIFLPLYYHNENKLVYSYGLATDFLVIVGIIFVIFDIVCIVKNFRNVESKKYFPLIILIVLLSAAITIRNINPGIILINSTFAFITALMFHTIENPDMQLIGELYKNKKLIEKSNDDTSRFLFRITADLKNPVKEIINISNDIKSINDIENLKEANRYINNYANQVDYFINKALNISSMDTGKIKVFENKYNVYNLFKAINYRATEEIKEPIKFNFNIGESIPTYLYGDAIKLKQVVTSAIRISQKQTETGFINLDVSSLIKYDICRLIINIEDSSKGISIDKVNEILSFTKNEEKTMGDSELDIFDIKRTINLLGGSFMLKSEEGKGTTITFVIDQKIVPTKETEITKKLENYEQTLISNKKVLLIDDNEEELDKITRMLEKEDIEVSASMFGRDAVENIKNQSKYDFMIIDDELTDTTAITILQALQKNKNFKTPVVVMINDNKEMIKLQYLKDGFADTISKSKLDTEIERILKRF